MKYIPAVIAALAFSQPALAQMDLDNYVRAQAGVTVDGFAMIDDNDDGYSSYELSTPLTLELQTWQGFFGGVGYTKRHLQKYEINRETVNDGGSYEVHSYGIGYRGRLKSHGYGKYVGVQYVHRENDVYDRVRNRSTEFDDTTEVISVFHEKDTDTRYGRISLSFEQNDELDHASLSGKHIWFFSRRFGAGINWSLGIGQAQLDEDEEAIEGTSAFGFSFMYRGDL